MKLARVLSALVVVLAILSFSINFRDHVSLLGGGDEGSYIACGKLMSQELSFVYEDEAATIGQRYLPIQNFIPAAFKVYDSESSPVKVVSGWNKGFSFLTIPFWWFDTDAGWQYLTPLAGALSLVVLFLIGTIVRGPFVGFCAALLLATNFLQIWFSRYPMTEVVSQVLTLLMLLCVVVYTRAPQLPALVGFALAGSLSLFVHFGNAPIWLMLSAFTCWCALPIERSANPDTSQSGRSWRGFVLAPSRVRSFLSVGFLTGIVPAIVAGSYWFLDPGIQRYTKLGKKMADSTGRVGWLMDAFVTRLENLSIFLPLPVWGLLLLGLWLIVRERGIEKRLWLLFIGLAVCSFLVIVSTGVGTPRLLYVARRNVPVVLPMLFLVCGLALEYVRQKLRGVKFGSLVAPTVVLVLASLQVAAFAPIAEVDQGKGAPEMARRVRAELLANPSDKPTFVIVHKTSAIYNSGLRYVYGVPILILNEAVTADVINKMLDDGIRLYAIDIAQLVVGALKQNPGVRLEHITSRRLGLSHANPLGPTVEPAVSDRLTTDVGLYRVLRRAQ